MIQPLLSKQSKKNKNSLRTSNCLYITIVYIDMMMIYQCKSVSHMVYTRLKMLQERQYMSVQISMLMILPFMKHNL